MLLFSDGSFPFEPGPNLNPSACFGHDFIALHCIPSAFSGEKLLSTCVGRSAASDEAQVLSCSMATGIAEEELELVLKTGFTLNE